MITISWQVETAKSSDGEILGYAVVRKLDRSVESVHATEDDDAHLDVLVRGARTAALELEQSTASCTSQWQALYGGIDGQWAVITGPVGYAPPTESGKPPYLGEPSELLHKLHQYRLKLSRSGVTDHIRRTLATELEITPGILESYLYSGSSLTLPNAGWANLVRSCVYMQTGAYAEDAHIRTL